MYFCVTTSFVLASFCLRDAVALNVGAPTAAACSTLTQKHPGAGDFPVAASCTNCPFTVSLVAIDGEENNGTEYSCGSQHTLRLESSGPTFHGLAVQVREATGSSAFSNDAAFVGQFVNPPTDGDWRIWSCAAPSATHSDNLIEKTQVDMSWQAPSRKPERTSVTVWFTITSNFIAVHQPLMGMTMTPDPISCRQGYLYSKEQKDGMHGNPSMKKMSKSKLTSLKSRRSKQETSERQTGNTCTDLGKLEGGYIQYSDNTKVVGSVATYYCCTEYERASSNSQRMCMSDGQWNGTEFKCHLRRDIAIAISVLLPAVGVATPLVVIISILVVLLKKSYNQQKLTHYDYVLPPLPPPRLRRTDSGSGIYDSIRCESTRDVVTISETVFTTAMIVNSLRVVQCHLSEQTQSTSPSNDLLSTVDASDCDTEISAPEGGNNTDVTSRESAGDVMRHPSAADRFGIQSETRENRTATGNSTAAESEVTRVLDESDNTSCVEERKREDEVTPGESRTEISDGRTVESIHDGQEESAIIIMMQENVSYQPSTTFVLAANRAYGTGIANAPEIPTENNVAYQRVCSGSLD